MKFTRLETYWAVLKNQIFKSRRQWIVLIFSALALGLGIFFNHSLQTVENAFVEHFKGIYPPVFLQGLDLEHAPISPRYIHQPEIFELAESFSFHYSMSARKITLTGINIRSAAKDWLPPIIDSSKYTPNLKYYLWINDELWKEISSSKDFDQKGIYLGSVDSEAIYCVLLRFKFSGDDEWAVLPESVVSKLDWTNNITTIYSKQGYIPDKQIREDYIAAGVTNISLWSDRLPYFSKVFYSLMEHFVTVISLSLMLLIFFVAKNFLLDAIKEFRQMILVLSFFGTREVSLQLFVGIFVVVYFTITLLLGGGIAALVGYILYDMPVLKMLGHLDIVQSLQYVSKIALSILPIFLLTGFGFVKLSVTSKIEKSRGK